MPSNLPSWILPGNVVLASAPSSPFWPAYVGTEEKGGEKVLAQRDQGKRKFIHVIYLNDYDGQWIDANDTKEFTLENANAIENSVRFERFAKGLILQWRGAVDEAQDRIREGQDDGRLSRCELHALDMKDVFEGDCVIARFDGFPDWPAVVENETDRRKRRLCGTCKDGEKIHIKFLIENSTTWISIENCTEFSMSKKDRCLVRENNIKFNDYNKAFEEAMRLISDDSI